MTGRLAHPSVASSSTGPFRAPAIRVVAWLVAALLPPILLVGQWDAVQAWRPLGIQGIVDGHDIAVYFASSHWVTGAGVLYQGVPSEYPLLANILFAALRVVADWLRPETAPSASFEFVWVVLGWWTWLAGLAVLRRTVRGRAIWLWLTPATLYFSLFRFDAFPVLATLVALTEARAGRPRSAAAWLGIAIALKGYALYVLPAFLVWAWLGWGRRRSIEAVVIALGPLVASLAIAFALGGFDAMLYPYRFQAIRGPNGQSTWDMLRLVTTVPFVDLVRRFPILPTVLQVAGALLAAGLRPRTFEGLVRSFVVAVGSFVTFSVFYSPQFFLWFVPAAALSDSVVLEAAVLTLGWITVAYFPLLYFDPRIRIAYHAALLAVTAVRTVAIAAALCPSTRSDGETPSRPAAAVRLAHGAERLARGEEHRRGRGIAAGEAEQSGTCRQVAGSGGVGQVLPADVRDRTLGNSVRSLVQRHPAWGPRLRGRIGGTRSPDRAATGSRRASSSAAIEPALARRPDRQSPLRSGLDQARAWDRDDPGIRGGRGSDENRREATG